MLVCGHAGRAREVDGVLSLRVEDTLAVRQEGVRGEQDINGVPHRGTDDVPLALGRTDGVGTYQYQCAAAWMVGCWVSGAQSG